MAITGCDRIPRALRRGPAALPADQDPPARSRSASTHAARWPGVISTTGGLAAHSGKARGHRSTKTQPERGDEGCPETTSAFNRAPGKVELSIRGMADTKI